MLDAIGYKGKGILGRYILENSCGEGNILIEIVKRYIEAARELNYTNEKIKEELEKYILGFEIDTKIRNLCLEKLDKVIKEHGISSVKWNIKNVDYLKYNIEVKVDFIVGNPPYIMYQDMDDQQREFLRMNFTSCIKGKFDYCYAFIEKSIGELSNSGRMAYFIPNSIFKNVFGNEIRRILRESISEIFDYKVSAVFGSNILTSPAIICLDNSEHSTFVKYHDVDNSQFFLIDKKKLTGKWIFTENGGGANSRPAKKFGDFFKVSNSVATLLNSAYLIHKKNITHEDDFFVEVNGYYLEKEILRPAASLRNYAINRAEYIIFPYKYENDGLRRFEESEFKHKFPGTYRYLMGFLERLNNRKSDKSAKWYEYGRSQALLYLNQEKIILSSVITNEVKCYKLDKQTVPYSGFYVTPISSKKLEEAEKILKSKEFFEYLAIRGINANGKSVRLSVKDIMDYPLIDATLS